MSAIEIDNISTTLILRSLEEGKNLLYIVEIETPERIHFCYSSENYNQAFFVAKRVFNKMKTNLALDDFGVLIESRLGRGVSYDINHFCNPEFNDAEDYYEDLVNEFESTKMIRNIDNNSLFREIIIKNRLNEYQERRFLYYLKEFSNEKKGD